MEYGESLKLMRSLLAFEKLDKKSFSLGRYEILIFAGDHFALQNKTKTPFFFVSAHYTVTAPN